MSDLAMDLATNDLLIVDGDLSIVTGLDAICQDLQQTMQLWFGEWFLDTTKGIQFRQQILVKNPNIDIAQAALVDAASGVAGVIEIVSVLLTYSSTNRSLSVTIKAKASNGQTITAQANVGTTTDATIEGTPY